MKTVGMVMKSPVITAKPEDTLAEILKLSGRHQIRHFPVVKNGVLVGIVTDRDLREISTHPAVYNLLLNLLASLDRATLEDIMVRNVISATIDTPLAEAARIMIEKKIGCLPIEKDGQLVGIVTHTDLLAAL